MKYRKEFYFDGKSSKDFGLYISGDKTFNGTTRNMEKVSIPGRNGDLYLPSNTFENTKYSFDAFIFDQYKYERMARDARSWLLSKDGYKRLEDDYHPDEFRMAVFVGPVDFNTILLQAGTTTITFDCKPQRFLKSGEDRIVSMTPEGITVFNPTFFDALPILILHGNSSGSVSINDKNTITFTDSVAYVVAVDCETCQTYYQSTGAWANDKLIIEDGWFPILEPGENTVKFSDGITKVEIVPRWYTL